MRNGVDVIQWEAEERKERYIAKWSFILSSRRKLSKETWS